MFRHASVGSNPSEEAILAVLIHCVDACQRVLTLFVASTLHFLSFTARYAGRCHAVSCPGQPRTGGICLFGNFHSALPPQFVRLIRSKAKPLMNSLDEPSESTSPHVLLKKLGGNAGSSGDTFTNGRMVQIEITRTDHGSTVVSFRYRMVVHDLFRSIPMNTDKVDRVDRALRMTL